MKRSWLLSIPTLPVPVVFAQPCKASAATARAATHIVFVISTLAFLFVFDVSNYASFLDECKKSYSWFFVVI